MSKPSLKKFALSKTHLSIGGLVVMSIGAFAVFSFVVFDLAKQVSFHTTAEAESKTQLIKTEGDLASAEAELNRLISEDQFVRNEKLQSTIENIEATYKSAVNAYESLLKLKESAKDTDKFDDAFTNAIVLLSEQNYASAESALKTLNKDIAAEQAKIAQAFTIPDNVTVQTAPPGSGFGRQRVDTPVGNYLVDIVAADLNATRVVVDTASEGTCENDCPVDSLSSYVSRSGGFAGINGPYFCPASYPSCAGKTNSFDTLLMNKNKVYFNGDNNVYSTVPAVIFSGNSARFVGKSLEWGRDTGPDSVIASQPLLMFNGQRVFGGDGEPKRAGKGSRSFIGVTGNMVYIGVVHNASVAEVAYVLEAMGIQNALNLDSGGSTALLYQGKYYDGPGRNLPFGIVLQRK